MTTKNLETIIIGVKIYLLRSAVKSHTYGTISCPSPQKNLQRTAHLCLIFANIVTVMMWGKATWRTIWRILSWRTKF